MPVRTESPRYTFEQFAAIRRYQQDYGLPVTGEVSLALVNHLRLITGFPVGYPQSQI